MVDLPKHTFLHLEKNWTGILHSLNLFMSKPKTISAIYVKPKLTKLLSREYRKPESDQHLLQPISAHLSSSISNNLKCHSLRTFLHTFRVRPSATARLLGRSWSLDLDQLGLKLNELLIIYTT
jgi:hypothetical protein